MKDKDIEQEILAKGLTAPRVTPQHIESVIVAENYFNAADGVLGAYKSNSDVYVGTMPSDNTTLAHSLLTFCVLVLSNGFTVTGESACASPENFDPDIGRKIARENAINKVWMLEGYLLKQKLSEQQTVNTESQHMPPHQMRVVEELGQLHDRLEKLSAFIDGDSAVYANLDEGEKMRLRAQAVYMADYADVLESRIAHFPTQ